MNSVRDKAEKLLCVLHACIAELMCFSVSCEYCKEDL